MNRFGGSANLVAAADGNLRFKGAQVLGFQAAYSAARTHEGQDLRGGAHYVWYELQGRHWRIFLNELRIAPDYRNALAYVRRTGIHANALTLGYEFQPSAATWWVRVRPFTAARLLRTRDGLIDESYADPGVDITLARDIRLYLYHSFHRDAFGGREFPYTFNVADTTFNTFKRLTVAWRIQVGEGVNFDPQRPVVGDSLDMSLTMTFKPIEPLDQQVLFLTSRLDDQATSARLFQQDIYRSRTNYQFTRSHAARAILEYNTRTGQLASSLLYSYTPQANTAVYVGYGDVRSDVALDPAANPRRWEPLQRTAFVKVSVGLRP
jgi:hypothetical protein